MVDHSREEFAVNPFWNYSLELYDHRGVAEACLALQDRLGLDVNLLLLCCWSGTRGLRLDSVLMARLCAASGPWQREVVRPLRDVRRRLKVESRPAAGALRKAIMARELEAERIEQDMLHETLVSASVPAVAAGPELAASNLRIYLSQIGVEPGEVDLAALAVLLRGAYPGVADEISALLGLR